MKKMIYVFFGAIALILGTIGVVLPVLPTTPLLLLAMYCFTKGSDRLNKWFRGTKLYKKYLEDYAQKKAMSLKQKLSIQIFAGIVMVLSFILNDSWHVRIIVIIALLIHNYVFIFKIKTFKPGGFKKQIVN